MIVHITKTIGGVTYDYTYSDLHMMIEREGVQYVDAIDPLNSGRVYTETDIPIEPAEESETNEIEDYAEAGRILLGEDE